jgi:RHS repeat-associated protein
MRIKFSTDTLIVFPMTVKIFFIFFVSLFLLTTLATAGNGLITGPTTADLSGTFSYEVTDDATYAGWHFTVTGGSIQSSRKSGFHYYVTVKFNRPGTQNVKFLANGNVVYDTYAVSVSGCPNIPRVNNGVRCGPGIVNLTATADSGCEVRWYLGGNYIATGNSFNTPSISSGSVTYQAEAYYAPNNCASARVDVTASINDLPPLPTSIFASPTGVCGSGTVALSASPVVSSESFVWYNAAGNTTTSTPTASASSPTFSVARRNNSTGCIGQKISLGITIDTAPVPFTVGGGGTYCASNPPPPVTLNGSQSGLIYSLIDAGNTQYGSITGTGGALTWTTPSAATGIFSVKVFSEHYVCSLPMTASAAVTRNHESVGGTLSPSVIHSYGPANGTITLSGHTGSVLQWEVLGAAGWEVAPGTEGATSYTYSGISNSTFVRAVIQNGVCPPVHSQTAIVNVYPVLYISASQTVIAYGGSVNLQVSQAYQSYQWNFNGVPIPGATTYSYDATRPGRYGVMVQGSSNAPSTGGEVKITRATDARNNLESTTVMRERGVKTSTNLFDLPSEKLAQVIIYSDGMGRPIQSIAIGQSPRGRDVVQYSEYSIHGLSEKRYLPYVSNTRDGQQRENPSTDLLVFHAGSGNDIARNDAPYAVTKLADSPLANVREQGAPGTDWQPGAHSVKLDLMMNTGNQVRYWKPDGTTDAYYAANTLAVNQTTDENGHKVRTFTDKLGKTVLKQVQLDQTLETKLTPWLETYYLYDLFGNLTCQLPPKAMALLGAGTSLTASDPRIKELIYQYTYDDAGRLTQKKVPNAKSQYFVYDRYDRLVLMQDGNLRLSQQWFFVKYDSRERVVMTGRYRDATHITLDDMQKFVRPDPPVPAVRFEEEGTTLHGYTNLSFPTANADGTPLALHAVNYYDHYNFDRTGAKDYTYAPQNLPDEMDAAIFVEGKPTGHKRLIDGSATWLTTVMFYDSYGHMIQQCSNNHLSAAMDNLSTAVYDGEGKVTYTKTYHNGGGTNRLTLLGRYAYDHAGRLTGVYQTLPGGAEQLVARYVYNELGQLIDKKLHATASGFLQSVDYRYNERGWLTSINNARFDDTNNADTDAPTDYFGMELLYEKKEAGLNDKTGDNANWNGNISAVKWRNFGAASGATDQRSYKYAYDKSDKLTTATFQTSTDLDWTKAVGTLNEQMTYDANGNMLTLKRNAPLRTFSNGTVSTSAQPIDNLVYKYQDETNTLMKVEDLTANADGFNNGIKTAIEYAYDDNGGLTVDKNKTIKFITYTVLGKPKTIVYNDGHKLEYTYDMDGNKLIVKTFASKNAPPSSRTDYVGGVVYENGVLSYFGSPEGRVVKQGGTYEYQYAIADHQGNTRVLFSSVMPAAKRVATDFETASTDFNNFPTGGSLCKLPLYDHTGTTTSTNSQLLNGGPHGMIGLAKSYKVYPGDKLKIEAYAKYFNPQTSNSNLGGFAGDLTAAFNLFATSTGEALRAYNGLNAFGSFIASGNGGGKHDHPKAFVNILLFDKNYKFVDIAADQIDGGEQDASSTKSMHDFLSTEYTVKEAGYAYVYISNETPTQVDVYFDDVTMTYTPTNVLQVNEYYPYGLQTANSWTREGNNNNFLYNGGTEQNATTGLYDLAYRNFDPALGRFHQVDPMASKYSALTPYSYANGNPASFNDPSGLESYSPQGGCNACVFARTFKDANYDADITPNGGPMFNPRFSGTNAQAIENFITQTLKGYGFGYGGSWNNGSVTMYATDEQALMAGYAYNDLHQSWANTALFGGLAGGDNLSGSILGDYKGISGTFKNVGFTDGSIGIHEKFIAFTQTRGNTAPKGSVEDIFRAFNKMPNGDITDEQLLAIDSRLSKVTGYSLKKVPGGVTLEVGRVKRAVVNAIPSAPKINSGNPLIHIQLINSWSINKTNVVHVWSSDIEISLDDGYAPLDIYINNNGYKILGQKDTDQFYPFFDGGKW